MGPSVLLPSPDWLRSPPALLCPPPSLPPVVSLVQLAPPARSATLKTLPVMVVAPFLVSLSSPSPLIPKVKPIKSSVNFLQKAWSVMLTSSSDRLIQKTKVELVTADVKVQQVVSMVNNWMSSHGKVVSAKSSEAQVTALTGGSNTYINTIMKSTGVASAQP